MGTMESGPSQEQFNAEADRLLNEAALLTPRDILWRIQQTPIGYIGALLLRRHSETNIHCASVNRRKETNPYTMSLPDSWGSTRRT